MTRTRVYSIIIILVLSGLGCDSKPKANYGRLKLINAGGTITFDGQPLADAIVSFDDPEDDTFAYGKTDSSGRFRLQIDSEMNGVKPGAKVVRISTSRKILGLNTDDDSDTKSATATERIPEKYNKKSRLFVEVVPSKANYDFDLKSN